MKYVNTLFKNKSISLLVTIFFSIFFLSFSGKTKSPHLIVGCWQISENAEQNDFLKKNYQIYQWYFSSDEFTCQITIKNGKNESRNYFAFKVQDSTEGFDKPILILKETKENSLLLVFSIQELTKSKLKLRFEKEISSKNVIMPSADIEFERIAGPSENME